MKINILRSSSVLAPRSELLKRPSHYLNSNRQFFIWCCFVIAAGSVADPGFISRIRFFSSRIQIKKAPYSGCGSATKKNFYQALIGPGSRIRIFLLFGTRTQVQKGTGSWILYPGSATLAAVLIDTFLFAVTTEVISLRKQLSQQQLAQQQLAQQQLSQQQQNGVHGIEDSKLLERANSLATRNVSLQVKVHTVREVWELILYLVYPNKLKKIGVTNGTCILVLFFFHRYMVIWCVLMNLVSYIEGLFLCRHCWYIDLFL